MWREGGRRVIKTNTGITLAIDEDKGGDEEIRGGQAAVQWAISRPGTNLGKR